MKGVYKRIILMFIFMLLFSCDMFLNNEQDYGFNSPFTGDAGEINIKVHNFIQYEKDNDNYIQSPKEVYTYRYGDCEDYCVLFAYCVKHVLGVEVRFYAVSYDPDGYRKHMVVEYGGIVYDPTNGTEYDSYDYLGIVYVLNTYSYDSYMERATDFWTK